jgi:YVTN family beta-propeller protein
MRLYPVLIAGFAATALTPLAPAADAPAPKLAVIGAIAGPDGGWDYASIDPVGRRLFVAHGDAVLEVDLDSGKVHPRLTAGDHLHAVLPLPGGKVLATNGEANTATLFDAGTGALIATIPTGQKPDAAIYDQASGLALVMNGHSGDVTLIDPQSAKAVGAIAVGGALEFAAADGLGRAYVNIEDKAEIAVLDLARREVVTHYALTGCEDPSGLAIDPATGVLVAACSNRVAIAVQSKDGTILGTSAIGDRPDATIFDPNRKLFFIPCGGDGTLAVIAAPAGRAPAAIASIATAKGARTGALDAKTGRLYLPTADFKPLQPGEKRPAAIPGTFRILIVGER